MKDDTLISKMRVSDSTDDLHDEVSHFSGTMLHFQFP